MDKLILRDYQSNDFPFLNEMLYEAVFWHNPSDRPSMDDGLSYPDVKHNLIDWGKRDGDTAVIAINKSMPVGAAWFRFWTDSNTTRGYINENIPVLAIGVHSDYRHQKIGSKMIKWLIYYAKNHDIQKISLAVTKDNYAINLYRQQGFTEYEDKGDWFIMVRDIASINFI